MGAAPHRVDSQHEGPSAGPEPDAQPRIPQPLPQADRRGRMAVAVIAALRDHRPGRAALNATRPPAVPCGGRVVRLPRRRHHSTPCP